MDTPLGFTDSKYKILRHREDLVLWHQKHSGNFLFRPRTCPHMGFDLTKGGVVCKETGNIQCPYHDKRLPGIKASEYGGYIVYRDSELEDTLSQLSFIEWPRYSKVYRLPTDSRNAMANLVDFLHLDTVHRYSIGMGLVKDSAKVEQLSEKSMRVTWDSKLFFRPTQAEVTILHPRLVHHDNSLASGKHHTHLLAWVQENQAKDAGSCEMWVSCFFDPFDWSWPLKKLLAPLIVNKLVSEDSAILTGIDPKSDDFSLSHEEFLIEYYLKNKNLR